MFKRNNEQRSDSIVFWKSSKTGFQSHGSLISSNSANLAARMGDIEYPEINHIAVTLTDNQLAAIGANKEEILEKQLDQFSPFRI